VEGQRRRQPLVGEGPPGEPLQRAGQPPQLRLDEAAGGRPVGAARVEEGEGRLPPAAQIGAERGQLLDRVAGVREEDAVHRLGVAAARKASALRTTLQT